MPAARSEDVPEVARDIGRYLQVHTDAADTAAGIARWWIGGRRVSIETIEAAMRLLIDRGIAEQQALPDGTVIYRAAR
jgi:hypothetical protein